MPKIRISVQALGNRATRDLVSGIIRAHVKHLKPKMRYYGSDHGPTIWVNATLHSNDIKSIDEFQEKYGNDILSEIRKHKIKGNHKSNALYMVNFTDCKEFQEAL